VQHLPRRKQRGVQRAEVHAVDKPRPAAGCARRGRGERRGDARDLTQHHPVRLH